MLLHQHSQSEKYKLLSLKSFANHLMQTHQVLKNGYLNPGEKACAEILFLLLSSPKQSQKTNTQAA